MFISVRYPLCTDTDSFCFSWSSSLFAWLGHRGKTGSTTHIQSGLTDQTVVELKEAFTSEVESQELVGAAAAVIIDGKVALLLVEGHGRSRHCTTG